MSVQLHWQYTGGEDENLDFDRVLYAYLHPRTSAILYIGKADFCTVRERLYGRHKEAIFESMMRELGLTELHAIVGVPVLAGGKRLTSELLADMESLLIIELQPLYNRQSRHSRISRPGLAVRCLGDWPRECDDEFFDE
jgi:hypothetical protein